MMDDAICIIMFQFTKQPCKDIKKNILGSMKKNIVSMPV